jgi:plasmid stability protein
MAFNRGATDVAGEARDLITKALTPEQLARAQEIATRCFESDYQDCE